MTILEEVIMYTFQQCVYYITKVIRHRGDGAIFLTSKTIIIMFLKASWMSNNPPLFTRVPDQVFTHTHTHTHIFNE